ncbi:MAG: MerR family transcriptional regulator [Candidatus Omnitrophica bacterium]|nr:MerR family transcriptional regulator [Candidatus Omnitrophota bacterium]
MLENREKKKFLSPQEITRDFGVSYQTLNYYTTIGLLHPNRREGNKRLYIADEIIKRLKVIGRLKNEGYPLKLISHIINGRKSF